MILNYGMDVQCEKYLCLLVSGEYIGVFCFIEVYVGSDVVSLCLKVECDGDDWVLNGVKVWIISGNYVDIFFVMV